MRVRMLKPATIEVHGEPTRLKVGDEAHVHGAQVRRWVDQGVCVVLDQGPKPGPRLVTLQPEVGASRPTPLTLAMRDWWYRNGPDALEWHGSWFPRALVHLRGGPNPELNDCMVCQEDEWLSRVWQRQTWHPEHGCSVADAAREMIARQCSPDWPHFQVNYWYAAKAGAEASAPRVLLVEPLKGYDFIFRHHCDQSVHVFLRQLAQECHYDVLAGGGEVDFKSYDMCVVVNSGSDLEEGMPVPPRGLPTVMYGHDLWKRREERQRYLDAVRPAILWTPFPSSWRAHFRIPEGTKVVFRPVPASGLFTEPCLDDSKKEWDLLVVGALGAPIYAPRVALDEQIEPFEGNFRVRFHHPGGSRRVKWEGRAGEDKMPYMNAWSRMLGKARFVIFGPIDEEPQPVFYKFYECLGSGAIPIMPEAPDLVLLGVKAWEHYIPLSHVWGSRQRMLEVLRGYETYRAIAENAVLWHEENADRLLFDGVAEVFSEATGGRFPARLRA